jgi:hypothetical protein
MRKLLMFVITFLLFLATALAQSPEEILIRQAFSRMSYGAEIGLIAKLEAQGTPTAEALNQALRDDALKFELTDFMVGNVSDPSFTGHKWDEFTSKPNGQRVLSTGAGSSSTTIKGKTYRSMLVTVNGWVNARVLAGPDANWNIPAGAALSMTTGSQSAARYASYTVTISYRSETHSGRGLWLFDKTGKPLGVVDVTTGIANPLLTLAVEAPRPDALLYGPNRDKPGIREWLQRNIDRCNCDLTPAELDRIFAEPVAMSAW